MIFGAVLLLCLVGMSMSQLSPYAAGLQVGGYPGVHPRYTSTSTSSPGLGDRINVKDEEEEDTGPKYAEGTLYDQKTVDWASKLPKDKQPFWYTNRFQIAKQRGDVVQRSTPASGQA